MRAQIIAGCSGVGFTAVSFALPFVFPTIDPLVAKGVLGIGVALIFVAVVLFFSGLKPKSSEAGQSSHGPHSPNFGGVGGDVNINYGPQPAPSPTLAPLTEQQFAALPGRGRQRMPELNPDLPLAGVLVRLYKILGPMPDEAARRANFVRRVDLEIADKAHQKRMHVWGRVGDWPIDRIGAHSLQYGKFDHAKKQFSAFGLHAVRPTIWTDLKFNRAEVDDVWPDV